MAGTPTYVDEVSWRWGEVPPEVVVDCLGTDPAAKRPIVTVNEWLGELGPAVVSHDPMMTRLCPAWRVSRGRKAVIRN
jgi:hypothetical protein